MHEQLELLELSINDETTHIYKVTVVIVFVENVIREQLLDNDD